MMEDGSPSDDWKHGGAQNNKKRLKLVKKCQKGELTTLEAYYECLRQGVKGKASFEVKLDPTRINCNHNLNLSVRVMVLFGEAFSVLLDVLCTFQTQEVRDLILSLIGNHQMPKYFEVKNRPFLRNIVICHASNVDQATEFLTAVGLGKAYTVRVSAQNNTEIHTIPRRLLSLSAEDVHVLGPQKSNQLLGSVEGIDSTARSSAAIGTAAPAVVKDWSNIASYVMSLSSMKTWGFPIPCIASNDIDGKSFVSASKRSNYCVEESEAELPQTKRVKADSSFEDVVEELSPKDSCDIKIVGVRVGEAFVPSRAVAVALSASLTTTSVSCGPLTLENFVCTLPLNSVEYNQLFVQDCSRCVQKVDIVAVDCEMCETRNGMELTRLTLIDEHYRVLLDMLVKPADPIIDYKTQWSGITAELLDPVTVTFQQAQLSFLRIVTAETILVGHSVDSDLRALHISHAHCVDTAILYPHPKGFPYRRKLKALAESYLKLQIQKSGGATCGHDSVEDARAAMRLAALKVEKGPSYGVKGSINSEDEFRQPISAFADISELCLLSGSLFLWTTTEHEKVMRCCVGNDALGHVVEHDIDRCMNIVGSYLSKRTRHIDQSLIDLCFEDGATESTINAVAGIAPTEGKLDIDLNVGNEEIGEEEPEKADISAEQIRKTRELEDLRKAEILNHSVLGEFGIPGVKLCYFEFDASRYSEPAQVLRNSIISLNHMLASEEAQNEVCSTASNNANSTTISSSKATEVTNTDATSSAAALKPSATSDSSATKFNSVGNTLLIITTQANSELATKLAKRKVACQNVRSTAIWTKELEEQLKQAHSKLNVAHVSFKIL